MSDQSLSRGDVITLLKRHHRPLSARRLLMLVNQELGMNLNYGLMLSTLRQWVRLDADAQGDQMIELRKGVFGLRRAAQVVDEPSYSSTHGGQSPTTSVHEASTRDMHAQSTRDEPADEELDVELVMRDHDIPTRRSSPKHHLRDDLGSRSVFTAHDGRQRAIKSLNADELSRAQRISEYLSPHPASPVSLDDVIAAASEHGADFERRLWSHLTAEAMHALHAFGYPAAWTHAERLDEHQETPREVAHEPCDESEDSAELWSDDEPEAWSDDEPETWSDDEPEAWSEASSDDESDDEPEAWSDDEPEAWSEASSDDESDDEPEAWSEASSEASSDDESDDEPDSALEDQFERKKDEGHTSDLIATCQSSLRRHRALSLDQLVSHCDSELKSTTASSARLEIRAAIERENLKALSQGARPPFVFGLTGAISLSERALNAEMRALENQSVEAHKRYQRALRARLLSCISKFSPDGFESLVTSLLNRSDYEQVEVLNRREDGRLALMAQHQDLGATLVIAHRSHKELQRAQLKQISRSLKTLGAQRALLIYLGPKADHVMLNSSEESVHLIQTSDLISWMIDLNLGVNRYPTSQVFINPDWLETVDPSLSIF